MAERPATRKTGLALVTGGAGFIGSHLVDAIVERGVPVRVVDNLSTGRMGNLAESVDRIEFHEGDLTDPAVAQAACEGVDCVYHVAALPSVPVSMERPLDTVRHGVIATVNVLVAAKGAGVRRVVFSSSSSVYGGEGPFPQREDAVPHPKNPYAASKLCCEVYVRTFAEAFGMDAVSLRYFNVFGPRQPVKGPYSAVFPAFITRMLRGEPPVIFGDGLQGRDFTFVSDVVRANLLAGERAERFAGEVVNVAAGREVTLLEIVAAVNGSLGTSLGPVFASERAGDVRHSCGDGSRAKAALGFAPATAVAEGIAGTVAWFRSLTTMGTPEGCVVTPGAGPQPQ